MFADLIRTYFSQSPGLPESLSPVLTDRLSGEPVRVFALADLDDKLCFSERWLVLTDRLRQHSR